PGCERAACRWLRRAVGGPAPGRGDRGGRDRVGPRTGGTLAVGLRQLLAAVWCPAGLSRVTPAAVVPGPDAPAATVLAGRTARGTPWPGRWPRRCRRTRSARGPRP